MENKKMPLITVLLLVALFLLDGVVIIGRFYAPNKLSDFLCFVIPYLHPFGIFVVHMPVNLLQYQCSSPIREPAISAIFLILKILFTICTAAYFCGLTLFTGMNRIHEKSANYIQQDSNLLCVIKNEFVPPVALLSMYFFMATMLNNTPNTFRIDIFNKVVEDLSCVILYSCIGSLAICILTCIAYAKDKICLNHKS